MEPACIKALLPLLAPAMGPTAYHRAEWSLGLRQTVTVVDLAGALAAVGSLYS